MPSRLSEEDLFPTLFLPKFDVLYEEDVFPLLEPPNRFVLVPLLEFDSLSLELAPNQLDPSSLFYVVLKRFPYVEDEEKPELAWPVPDQDEKAFEAPELLLPTKGLYFPLSKLVYQFYEKLLVFVDALESLYSPNLFPPNPELDPDEVELY